MANLILAGIGIAIALAFWPIVLPVLILTMLCMGARENSLSARDTAPAVMHDENSSGVIHAPSQARHLLSAHGRHIPRAHAGSARFRI